MRAVRKPWGEEETKLALFLYFQLPFGHLHSKNVEIQKLASILGRTNSSVAMKLCNFASLDPKIVESGRRGLQGASAQDRRVWAKFTGDWTAQIEESERAWNAKLDIADSDHSMLREEAHPFAFEPFRGQSTASATVERRIGQGFFRRAVLANFENTCCITGIAERTLLNASHIVPWGIDVQNRHNPANGLCLSATFDRAFDRGLVALNSSRVVLISKILISHRDEKTREYFKSYQGASIGSFTKFEPDPIFLSWHLNERFIDIK